MVLGSSQRMKIPLLASSVTQKSAVIWKSVYDIGVTRKPVPIVAWTAPSATDQFALPTTSQPFMLVPSSSVLHPPDCCAVTVGAATVNATTANAANSDASRVIAPP